MEPKIQAITQKTGGQWGIYAQLLGSDDEIININGDKKFFAASINKVAIALAVLKLVEDGQARLSELFELGDEAKVPGTGVLNLFQAGLKLTTRDAINLMLAQTDNTAAKLLVNRFGVKNINKTLLASGLKVTQLEDLGGSKFYYGYTTPIEAGKIMTALYQGDFIKTQYANLVLAAMKQCHLNWGIERYLPATLEVANKEGTWEDNRHEIAIIWGAKPYLLCIFATKLADQRRHVDNAGVLAGAEISRILYEEIG